MSRPKNYGTMSGGPEVAFEGTSSTDFNVMCENVVTNIYSINTSLKGLEACLKSVGTGRDNKGLRDKM